MSVSYTLQTAVVTGGARGIGRAIATQFVRSGAHVWIWDVDQIELDGAQSLKVDVTNSDQIAKAFEQVVSQSQRIDILVNNAGYLGSYQPFEQFDKCGMGTHPSGQPNRCIRGNPPSPPAHAEGGDMGGSSTWVPLQVRKVYQASQYTPLQAQD
jgi:NAD(P)-dependent dehydrogenase (short-subunit alcohol dehydrogenase family)